MSLKKKKKVKVRLYNAINIPPNILLRHVRYTLMNLNKMMGTRTFLKVQQGKMILILIFFLGTKNKLREKFRDENNILQNLHVALF